MWFEIRRETAHPGRGAELARWMEEQVIPLHQAGGMIVVGSFLDPDDADAFVWIRRFQDDHERQTVVERVHQDPEFESAVGARARELLAGEGVTTRLVPTAGSALS